MSFWQARTKIRTEDKLFSRYIRLRDKECQYQVRCYGHQDFQDLHCSHYIGRAKQSVRFDPQNADAACRSCHAFVHDTGGQEWLAIFKKKQLGEQAYNQLLLRASIPQKPDKVMIKLYLKQLLQDLNKSNVESSQSQ